MYIYPVDHCTIGVTHTDGVKELFNHKRADGLQDLKDEAAIDLCPVIYLGRDPEDGALDIVHYVGFYGGGTVYVDSKASQQARPTIGSSQQVRTYSDGSNDAHYKVYPVRDQIITETVDHLGVIVSSVARCSDDQQHATLGKTLYYDGDPLDPTTKKAYDVSFGRHRMPHVSFNLNEYLIWLNGLRHGLISDAALRVG